MVSVVCVVIPSQQTAHFLSLHEFGLSAFVVLCCVQICLLQVIVIARVLGIYGSKPTRVRGRSPRTRAVYVAINS